MPYRSFFRFVRDHACDRQTDGRTDGQTDRQTEFSSLDRVCITCSAVKSSKVSEQQKRNDEQQCQSCAAELTEASVWMIAASEADVT